MICLGCGCRDAEAGRLRNKTFHRNVSTNVASRRRGVLSPTKGSTHMRSWATTTIRAFTIANVILASCGLYFLVGTVLRNYLVAPLPNNPAYYAQAFYGRSIINLLFLVALLAASGSLWRFQRRGLLICNAVFIIEIVYFIGGEAIELALGLAGGKARVIALSMGAAGGTGNMGIALQTLTGYPLIALIALNIAYRKLRGLAHP
jgi:hypothetical protein